MASSNFSTRFNFWTKERIGWGRRSAQKFFPSNAIDYSPPHYWQGWVYLVFIHNLCICICVLVFEYLWLSPLIIGRVECISYSFSVYQGSLGWHFRSFCATRSQREAAIKDSGLVPHRALFRFLSLPEKGKKSTYFNWNCRCTDLGDFLQNPTIQSFCWQQIARLWQKEKNILWLQFIFRLKGKDSPEIFTQDLEVAA